MRARSDSPPARFAFSPPWTSHVTDQETGRALFALAGRVSRLHVSRRDPEQFFCDRSEIAHDLIRLAEPLRASSERQARERFSTGEIRVRGRAIPVELRAPFRRTA